MYRVWYTFRNGRGEDVRAYLDNNGRGFNDDDAVDISRELRAQGHGNVRIVIMGNLADKEELRGIAAGGEA